MGPPLLLPSPLAAPPALSFPLRTVSVPHLQWAGQLTPSRGHKVGTLEGVFSQPEHRFEHVCVFLESDSKLLLSVFERWIFVANFICTCALTCFSKSLSNQGFQAQFPTHGTLSF